MISIVLVSEDLHNSDYIPALRTQWRRFLSGWATLCHNVEYLFLCAWSKENNQIATVNIMLGVRSNPSYFHPHNQQITIFVAEHFDKWFSCYFCLCIKFICQNIHFHLHALVNKTQCIIPQSIKFYDISGTGITGCPLTVEFIHVNRLFRHLHKSKPFSCKKGSHVYADDIIHNIFPNSSPYFKTALFTRCLLCILLQSPYGP